MVPRQHIDIVGPPIHKMILAFFFEFHFNEGACGSFDYLRHKILENSLLLPRDEGVDVFFTKLGPGIVKIIILKCNPISISLLVHL